MENIKRVTKSQRYEDIIAILNGDTPPYGSTVQDALDFIGREMELLARKNSSDTKKPTAVQAANEGYKAQILEFLSNQDNPVSCGDIKRNIPELSVFENQKTAALLRSLVESEKVKKETIKGKSMFSLR